MRLNFAVPSDTRARARGHSIVQCHCQRSEGLADARFESGCSPPTWASGRRGLQQLVSAVARVRLVPMLGAAKFLCTSRACVCHCGGLLRFKPAAGCGGTRTRLETNTQPATLSSWAWRDWANSQADSALFHGASIKLRAQKRQRQQQSIRTNRPSHWLRAPANRNGQRERSACKMAILTGSCNERSTLR